CLAQKAERWFRIAFENAAESILRGQECPHGVDTAKADVAGIRGLYKISLAGIVLRQFLPASPCWWRITTGRRSSVRLDRRFDKKCRLAGSAAVCFGDSDPGPQSHREKGSRDALSPHGPAC